MKKVSAGKLAVAVAASSTMLATMGGAVFAETVPVYLTAAATPIDVTIGTGIDPVEVDPDGVPDSGDEYETVTIDPDGVPNSGDEYTVTGSANAIYMKAAADSNTATVTGLVVKNNQAAAPVYISNILLNNITSGYTNANYSDDFSTKAVDSKNFGLAITGKNGTPLASAVDLKGAGYTPTGANNVDTIAAGATLTYNLSGKVSASSTAIDNAKIADCVVTISQTITNN